MLSMISAPRGFDVTRVQGSRRIAGSGEPIYHNRDIHGTVKEGFGTK